MCAQLVLSIGNWHIMQVVLQLEAAGGPFLSAHQRAERHLAVLVPAATATIFGGGRFLQGRLGMGQTMDTKEGQQQLKMVNGEVQ